MRIKQRIDDFRVRELLAPDFLQERGEFRVYRVTKRKLTSFDAAKELAYAAGVPPAEVAMAGLKDRQGVTIQYMTIRRGREVDLRALDLSVETAGFSRLAIESSQSLGNAFEVTLRGLVQEDLDVLRDNVPLLRECAMINYFDEQRFGNLRHNQGWIAQQLMRGEHEAALKRLLASLSEHDDGSARNFKTALLEAWGDWSACRELAGRFGQHHSVFEYLKQHGGDFAGAFFHVSSRLRLIHLYAFQSHIWNRAVADFLQSIVPLEERVVLGGIEGPLVYPSRPLPVAADATFRLPGVGLEDVRDPAQRGWLEDALSRERMVGSEFRIDGVPGFQLKGEERALLLQPRHLRVRPPERDNLNFGAFAVKVRFELPRGAYATLVVRRLLSTPRQSAGRDRGADRGKRDPRAAHGDEARGRGRSHEGRGERRDERGRWEERGRREDRGMREDSAAREARRNPIVDHRESGESLAPPRRDSYGRDDRDTRGRGRGGEDRRPFVEQGRGPRAQGDQRGQRGQRDQGDQRGRSYRGSDSGGGWDPRSRFDQRVNDRWRAPPSTGGGYDRSRDQRGFGRAGQSNPGAERGSGFQGQRPWREDRGRPFTERDRRGARAGSEDRSRGRAGGFQQRRDERSRRTPDVESGERDPSRDDA